MDDGMVPPYFVMSEYDRQMRGSDGFREMCEGVRQEALAAERALPALTRARRRLRARAIGLREGAALRLAPWLEPE
jgi:hypothetical protein